MSLRPFPLMCGALLLLSAPPVFAAPSVQFGAMVTRIPPDANLPAVFGNREEGFSIQIDGVAATNASLQADMFQIADKLAMPLSKDIPLGKGLTFLSASPTSLWTSVKFPDVKRQTEILLRLELIQGAPQAVPIPLGDIRFKVFPSSVTKDLTDLLQPKAEGSPSIIIFGSGQKLRHFLTNLHVPFEDAGAGTPDRLDPNRLYLGELNDEEQSRQVEDRKTGVHLALFSPDTSLPPGIYADRTHSGAFVHVTSPLLDNLADDPRAQLGLIKIIHLLSAPTPSDN